MTVFSAEAALLQPAGDGIESGSEIETVEIGGVHQQTLSHVGLGLNVYIVAVTGCDNLDDGQPVVPGELVVAQVVTGNRHDGAGAVTHEDEVGHPHRQPVSGDGMDGVAAQRHAALFHGLHGGFRGFDALALVDEARDVGIVRGRRLRQRVPAATAI